MTDAEVSERSSKLAEAICTLLVEEESITIRLLTLGSVMTWLAACEAEEENIKLKSHETNLTGVK